MFIEPSTNIRLIKSVPLDSTYQHTYYFPTLTAQTNYFLGLPSHNLPNQSYQRKDKGVARVNYKAEDIYDCNYMMFQNTNFGTKWFYAFIKSIDYVNNVVSEITFEIDVLQTWFFDYELKDSFVEREHALFDTIGANTVPEKLETGEYIMTPIGENTGAVDGTNKLGDYQIVIAATVEEEGYDVTGGEYSGIYSGLYFNVFEDYNSANDFIEGLSSDARSNAIVSVFMMPKNFITEIGGNIKSYTISKQKRLDSIDGYVPKNKKLFTYPYNFLYVSNLEGNSAVFPYEYFSTETCDFVLAGDFSCNPGVLLYPLNYKGAVANFDEKLSITGFPQCSWNTDSFKAWLAQSSVSTGVNTALGIGSGLLTASMFSNPVTGTIAGGIAIASTIAGSLQQVYEHAIMPNQAHGGNCSYTQAALGIKDFAFMHKHIKREFAVIIDRYFHMYGYATNKVKVPNRSARPIWNYVKTLGCNAFGSVPADDMKKIKSIYDTGITFWKTGYEIGKYTDETGNLLSNNY